MRLLAIVFSFFLFNDAEAVEIKCSKNNYHVFSLNHYQSNGLGDEYKKKCITERKIVAPPRVEKNEYDCTECIAKMTRNSPNQEHAHSSAIQRTFKKWCQGAKEKLCKRTSRSYMMSSPFSNSESVSCEGQMFCSEVSETCEYVCDEEFSYNYLSGLCEKSCLENEISNGTQCIQCNTGKIPNSAGTQCVCPAGETDVSGQCMPMECPVGQGKREGQTTCEEIVNSSCADVELTPFKVEERTVDSEIIRDYTPYNIEAFLSFTVPKVPNELESVIPYHITFIDVDVLGGNMAPSMGVLDGMHTNHPYGGPGISEYNITPATDPGTAYPYFGSLYYKGPIPNYGENATVAVVHDVSMTRYVHTQETFDAYQSSGMAEENFLIRKHHSEKTCIEYRFTR